MDCCYVEEECEDYSVRPMLMVPCAPVKCRDEAPACFPCLPRCSKKVYCCEKPRPKPTIRSPAFSEEPEYDCCQPKKHSSRPRSSDDSYTPPQRQARCPPPPCYEPCCQPTCEPVKTKYVIPCYRYEDGRIVRQLPVSAFKRNGMQDQEHSVLGTPNFLQRCPRDVSIECDVCTKPVKVCDPAKVPLCDGKTTLGCTFLRKKPIKTNQPTLLMRRACEVAIGKRPRKKPFVESCYRADSDHQESRYISEDEQGNCCYHFEKKNLCPTTCPPQCPPPKSRCPNLSCLPCQSCPDCQYQDYVVACPVDTGY